MTFIWLIAWLIKHTPDVHMWNNWAIALGICMFLDIAGGRRWI